MEDLHNNIQENTKEFELKKQESYKPKSWEEELNSNPYLSQSDWKFPKKTTSEPELNPQNNTSKDYQDGEAKFMPNPLESANLSAEFLDNLKTSNENLNRFEEKLNKILESSEGFSTQNQTPSHISEDNLLKIMSGLLHLSERYEKMDTGETLQGITQAIQQLNQKMDQLNERIQENQQHQDPYHQRIDRLEKKMDLLINSLANTQKDFNSLGKMNQEIQHNQDFLTKVERKIEAFANSSKSEVILETQGQLSKGVEQLKKLLESLDQQISTAPEKEILPDILKSIRHNSDYLHGVKSHLEYFIEAREHTSPDAVLEGMHSNNLHLTKVEQKMVLLIQYLERLMLTLNKS